MFVFLPFNPFRPDPGRREKINLNFYFHTLWPLNRFFEDLKGFHKTFWGTTKKCENKNFSYFNTTFRNARGGKGQEYKNINHTSSKLSNFFPNNIFQKHLLKRFCNLEFSWNYLNADQEDDFTKVQDSTTTTTTTTTYENPFQELLTQSL